MGLDPSNIEVDKLSQNQADLSKDLNFYLWIEENALMVHA